MPATPLIMAWAWPRLGPGRKCSKHQGLAFNSGNDGLKWIEGYFEHFLPSPTRGAPSWPPPPWCWCASRTAPCPAAPAPGAQAPAPLPLVFNTSDGVSELLDAGTRHLPALAHSSRQQSARTHTHTGTSEGRTVAHSPPVSPSGGDTRRRIRRLRGGSGGLCVSSASAQGVGVKQCNALCHAGRGANLRTEALSHQASRAHFLL